MTALLCMHTPLCIHTPPMHANHPPWMHTLPYACIPLLCMHAPLCRHVRLPGFGSKVDPSPIVSGPLAKMPVSSSRGNGSIMFPKIRNVSTCYVATGPVATASGPLAKHRRTCLLGGVPQTPAVCLLAKWHTLGVQRSTPEGYLLVGPSWHNQQCETY